MIGYLLLVAQAWPCAGIVHLEDDLAEAEATEVLFEPGDGDVAVTYRVRYEGDAADFGWIVPLPGAFVSAEDADAGVLDDLDAVTQPMIARVSDDDGRGRRACGGALYSDRSDAGGDDNSLDVDVVAEGFTGSYEYVAIETGSADDLLAWLDAHGWSAGGIEPAIDHYVAQGDVFLALRIRPDVASTPDEGRDLPPIRIVHEGDVLRFPAYFAQYAAPGEQRTRIYVLGPDRAIASGWADALASEITGALDHDPTALFEDRLRQEGARTAFAVVYAGPWDGGYVTRLETIAPPSAHTVDATFAFGGGTQSFETWITLTDEPASESWLLLPLVGLGFGALRRRRR